METDHHRVAGSTVPGSSGPGAVPSASSAFYYPCAPCPTSWHIERGVLAAALALLVCAICSQQGAHAMPAPAYDFLFSVPTEQPSMFSENNECHQRSEVDSLCQRCAKSTKSNVVYPMCCENKEEAREWCERYMNFGIQ